MVPTGTGRPSPSLLPPFEWTDSKGTLHPITATADDATPRKITDYHIDPANWNTFYRYTPDEILHPKSVCAVCVVCNGGLYRGCGPRPSGPPCPGTPCVKTFRREACEPAEQLVEIRKTATMGLGIFAKVDMPRGTWLGEYLGELFPHDADASPFAGDMYVFEIQQSAQCSARQFGNWTRFINHACIPNVSSRNAVYGRRAAVLFRAARDLVAGEQLFISYGRDYFRGNAIRCVCDAFPNAPHWPPKDIPQASYSDDDVWRLDWKSGLVKQAEAENQTQSELPSPPEHSNAGEDPFDIILEGEPESESPFELGSAASVQDTSDDKTPPPSGLYTLPSLPFFVCANPVSHVSAGSYASGFSPTSVLSSAHPTPPLSFESPPPSTLSPSRPSSSSSRSSLPQPSTPSTSAGSPASSFSSAPSPSSFASNPDSPRSTPTPINRRPKRRVSPRPRRPSIGNSAYCDGAHRRTSIGSTGSTGSIRSRSSVPRTRSHTRVDKRARLGRHGMVLRSHALGLGERVKYTKYF